jgi:hypothetical protein|tara:strand:+ start:11251 stop:11568 length:318 start_codon:yes stop_codon:yes gene_type:complete
MRIRHDTWYFIRGFAGKNTHLGMNNGSPRIFFNKKDYDVFLLVNRNVLNEIQWEDEVKSYCVIPTYKVPFPVYAVAINTDNIQPMLDKYEVEGVWERNGSGVIKV